MQADIIHVMVRGRIVESGSHDELMEQNGRYAQSWMKQMQQVRPTFRSSALNPTANAVS